MNHGLMPDAARGFGRRLEQARTAAKLSRKAVADAANTTETTVYRWERRGQLPDPRTDDFGALLDLLGVSGGWLFFGEGDSRVEPDEHPAWAELSPDYLARVASVIPPEMLRWERMTPWGRGDVTREDVERRLDELMKIYRRGEEPEAGSELPEAALAREARAERGDPIEKLRVPDE